MNNPHILYIGVHGLAGSGKDTFSKMLALLLNNSFETKEAFKQEWEETLKEIPNKLATFNSKFTIDNTNRCVCIAFADQLKHICSDIFGIPVDRFYFNKGNGWVAIDKDFKYTETKPYDSQIITAEDFYTGYDKYTQDPNTHYMSLREILVYVGTYILQTNINKNTFVNIVNNKIKQSINDNLKYVIMTDVRFEHEFNFIRENNGVVINVVRPEVKQLDNIAEHELDDFDMFDITIDNSGTYDDLVDIVWDYYKNNIELRNKVTLLPTRDESYNFLRKIEEGKYKLCTVYGNVQLTFSNGELVAVDPAGGPMIFIGTEISNIGTVTKIEYDEILSKHILYIEPVK